jgi:ligand-binding SRPBCC domain-containing protein
VCILSPPEDADWIGPMTFREFSRTCIVTAPTDEVWERVVTPEGINDEMMPLMSMTMPRAHRGSSVGTVPIGTPLGKAWLRLFGVVPFDFDALTVTELEPGHHFQESSWMLSMRRWEHRRVLEPLGEGTRVTDTVGFEPRLPLLHHLLGRLLPLFFTHRHRRLQRNFTP